MVEARKHHDVVVIAYTLDSCTCGIQLKVNFYDRHVTRETTALSPVAAVRQNFIATVSG